MILPFSTFVTQIPFILMALVYLVFFGVSALSKSEQKESFQVCDSQQNTKECKAGVNASTGRTIHYQTLFSAHQDEAVSAEPAVVPEWRPFRNSLFILTGARTHQNFFSHSIFCRPPPVLA
jgi:hypothetical protein